MGSLCSAALRLLTLGLAFAYGHAVAGPTESSVWIDVSREDGVRFNGHRLPREAEGMGVVTAAREIATAAHVVWQAGSITVTDARGAKTPARIVCIDQAVDIALLRVERRERRPQRPANIRAAPAVTGEPVGVVRRAQPGDAPHVATGAIGATRWTANGVPVPLIFSGIKGEKGMSGGGLFDAGGDLLGIVIRIDGRLGYLSALPVAELCARFARCAATARARASVATARSTPASCDRRAVPEHDRAAAARPAGAGLL